MNDNTKTYLLPELIREGAKETRRCNGRFIAERNGQVYTCAAGAAAFALRGTGSRDHPQTLVLQQMQADVPVEDLPASLEQMGYTDPRETIPLWAAIERMNDMLDMSREAIAAWAEATMPEPALEIEVELSPPEARPRERAPA